MEKQNNFYVLIYNIQSRHNIQTLIRSALSFGCKGFFVLGKNKKVLEKVLENSKIDESLFSYFDTGEEIKGYCKEHNIIIVGIEIGGDSLPIQKMVFDTDALFVLGNEGAGMNQRQKELCDKFTYIQQYTEKTGSLNVVIAASIIFHHFFSSS